MDLARPEWTNFFREPRRKKVLARRAKTSHLGAFQALPETVLLSCLARLPREDHDAVADCSTGFRAVMRSERFLKARRAEDITEEALVLVGPGDSFMALVSGRVWRRLTPQPVHWRTSDRSPGPFRAGTTVIGSELFINGTFLTGYDAVDDEWFTLPKPKGCHAENFAVGCAGRLFLGDFPRLLRGQAEARPFVLKSWDPDEKTWIEHPAMPPPLMQRCSHADQLVAVAAGSEIFVLDRYDPARFRVFDVGTETWRTVPIPSFVTIQNPRDTTTQQRDEMKIPEPWPGLQVDRRVIHVAEPPSDGDNPRRDHYAYDTVIGQWVGFSGSFKRHSVFGESDRVISIENYDGPDDYVLKYPKVGRWNRGHWEPAQSTGGVWGYKRVGDPGQPGYTSRISEFTGLPVRYDAIEAAFYVHMP